MIALNYSQDIQFSFCYCLFPPPAIHNFYYINILFERGCFRINYFAYNRLFSATKYGDIISILLKSESLLCFKEKIFQLCQCEIFVKHF